MFSSYTPLLLFDGRRPVRVQNPKNQSLSLDILSFRGGSPFAIEKKEIKNSPRSAVGMPGEERENKNKSTHSFFVCVYE